MIFKTKTNEIINKIKTNNSDDIEFLDPNDTFINYIENELNIINMTRAELFKIIDIDYQNSYKIFSKTNKRPIKRDLAIKILIVLNKSFEEINQIFKKYSYPLLYPRDPRDYIIIVSLNQNHNITQLNNQLELNSHNKL